MATIGPGLLVAATGVGAGDLATAALTGSKLGVAVGWAVVIGALMKWLVNEGLARFQLATDETLLEGAIRRMGRAVSVVFLIYFLSWSLFVGAALTSACGVSLHALVPLFDEAETGKRVWGVVASLLGLGLVRSGGYALFERVMSACIGLMFLIVVVTASKLLDDGGAFLSGLVIPRIPDLRGEGLDWTLALMGGVGGTLTVLCYGYWIREKGRAGPTALGLCRLDLAVGYAVTAVFGLCMLVIGSRIEVEGRGAGLIVSLSEALEGPLGQPGRWAFLIGAFGAVFSSLLGVWQAVPYLFADYRRITAEGSEPAVADDELEKTGAYRNYQLALATVPLIGLFVSFARVQKIYALFGAFFVGLLAVVLMRLNGRRDIVGELRNGFGYTLALAATVLMFLAYGVYRFV